MLNEIYLAATRKGVSIDMLYRYIFPDCWEKTKTLQIVADVALNKDTKVSFQNDIPRYFFPPENWAKIGFKKGIPSYTLKKLKEADFLNYSAGYYGSIRGTYVEINWGKLKKELGKAFHAFLGADKLLGEVVEHHLQCNNFFLFPFSLLYDEKWDSVFCAKKEFFRVLRNCNRVPDNIFAKLHDLNFFGLNTKAHETFELTFDNSWSIKKRLQAIGRIFDDVYDMMSIRLQTEKQLEKKFFAGELDLMLLQHNAVRLHLDPTLDPRNLSYQIENTDAVAQELNALKPPPNDPYRKTIFYELELIGWLEVQFIAKKKSPKIVFQNLLNNYDGNKFVKYGLLRKLFNVAEDEIYPIEDIRGDFYNLTETEKSFYKALYPKTYHAFS